MNSISASRPGFVTDAATLSRVQRAVLLSITTLFALVIIYFVGIDQGMTSVFGDSTVIHEWVHDGRHFLGFPCH